jgi:hypothetical protein
MVESVGIEIYDLVHGKRLGHVNPFDFTTPTDGGKNATHMRGD